MASCHRAMVERTGGGDPKTAQVTQGADSEVPAWQPNRDSFPTATRKEGVCPSFFFLFQKTRCTSPFSYFVSARSVCGGHFLFTSTKPPGTFAICRQRSILFGAHCADCLQQQQRD